MLKIAVTVNPNKDKNLQNTAKLLTMLKKYNVRVMMSESLKNPYGGNPPLSETVLSDFNIEYCPRISDVQKSSVMHCVRRRRNNT